MGCGSRAYPILVLRTLRGTTLRSTAQIGPLFVTHGLDEPVKPVLGHTQERRDQRGLSKRRKAESCQ